MVLPHLSPLTVSDLSISCVLIAFEKIKESDMKIGLLKQWIALKYINEFENEKKAEKLIKIDQNWINWAKLIFFTLILYQNHLFID